MELGPGAAEGTHPAADSSRTIYNLVRRGAVAWIWLLIVLIPIYWIVITSFKTQSNYYATNPLKPTDLTLTFANYKLVIAERLR